LRTKTVVCYPPCLAPSNAQTKVDPLQGLDSDIVLTNRGARWLDPDSIFTW